MSGEVFKSLPTDYREFKGVTSAELGYGDEAVNSRFFEHIAENGQRVGVYETKSRSVHPKDSDLTIIVPASHDYRIEPNWMKRADIIASSSSARVILVDMPGTTGLLRETDNNGFEVYETTAPLTGSHQKPLQLIRAIGGDFRTHADVQLEAIRATAGLSKGEATILLGESMGAQVVTDMLALSDEHEIDVREIILYEAVNLYKGYHPANPLKLMKVLGSVENDRRTHYIHENEEIGHPSTAFEMEESRPYQKTLDSARKTLGQQGIAAAANGLGLARGVNARLQRTVSAIPRSERPMVTMVRGKESLATNWNDYASLYEILCDLRMNPVMHEVVDAADLPYPIGHSHTFSLARQRQVADILFE